MSSFRRIHNGIQGLIYGQTYFQIIETFGDAAYEQINAPYLSCEFIDYDKSALPNPMKIQMCIDWDEINSQPIWQRFCIEAFQNCQVLISKLRKRKH